jgi:hypothetical protein
MGPLNFFKTRVATLPISREKHLVRHKDGFSKHSDSCGYLQMTSAVYLPPPTQPPLLFGVESYFDNFAFFYIFAS